MKVGIRRAARAATCSAGLASGLSRFAHPLEEPKEIVAPRRRRLR